MEPADIDEIEGARKIVLAKDQPQYGDLPALLFPDGAVLSQWSPNFEERQAILDGADVWLWVWTHGRPHQPVSLQVQGIDYEKISA